MDLSPRTLARWAGSFFLGVVIGVIGTGVHRLSRPWGLVLALAIVLLGGVVARAWTGGGGMLALGLGVATTTAVLGTEGPGGDTLVPADVYGYIWYVGALVVALALLLPGAWFRERAESRPDA
ncbi:hypothetical protein OEB99_19070 [Actinotalea sp. M2MS4P-6]|uniref:hypothetical protein n=1 Tax=Actinotalea sp. M2MS4P-6 TaxID=2983762 RepID=UPI0021E43771|nr:hypothetical protein [Actinotalea sp. M2MS4P-6]MCV2396418.1 hypothetical protein [Actinotalea sp. M2MS4P-6]